MNTAVSVVIPVHNHGDSLASAVASVRAQSWPNVEIIIVNDGSTDDTAKVVRGLQASDVRVHQQANLGPAEARNVGIRRARHAWVGFLDADDTWLPGKLQAQFEELARSPAAAFSYGDAWVVAPDGSEKLFTCRLPSEVLRRELLFGNRLATPTVLVRRDCFSVVGAFDRTLPTGEDWDLWLRLAWRFRGAPVGEPLARVKRTLRHRATLPTLERCTLQVLDGVFSRLSLTDGSQELLANRETVLAWHRAVLAKSYLRAGAVPHFARLVVAAMAQRPGTFLLALGGRRPGVSGTFESH